jgi:HPt (histidine-containing phosphotransfer) domain-containing protein
VELALKRLGNNQGLLQRSLVSFVTDARALPERLEAGLHRGDRAQVLRELHAFKGLSATVGVLELSALAARAESLLKTSGPGEEYGAAVATLQARLVQLLPMLESVATRLAPPRVAAAGTAPVPLEGGTLKQLKDLLVALQASDMGAMELHARLRQSMDESQAEAMESLDEAMADLEFDQAAAECHKLVLQFETH